MRRFGISRYLDWILYFQNELRLSFFVGGFVFFIVLALGWPLRKQMRKDNSQRRFSNIALTVSNSILLKALFPIGAVAMAEWQVVIGVLPRWTSNLVWQVILGVVFLDLVIYLQHRLFHQWAPLWRLHRVHHSDPEFDTTTALRFHSVEIVLSYLIKIMAIIVIGVPSASVVIFEVVLNFSAMFNHSNFALPVRLEKLLRVILVTPDLHRVHHSVHHEEMNSNYGFCLSLWDQLFRTYKTQTPAHQKTMKIGLNEFRSVDDQSLLQLLKQPIVGKTED